MEAAVQAKPRLSYQQFLQQKPAGESLAALCIRVRADIAAHLKQRQLSDRFKYHLDLIGRSSIGRKVALKLTEQDVITYARERAEQVGKATCKHDLRTITFVLKHAKMTWAEYKDAPLKAVEDAMPYLIKNGIAGQGNVRERKCSPEEKAALIGYFVTENARGRNEIRAMPDIIEFALISARRRSEICRITWEDVDFERQIYWVRDVKHPTKKAGNDKSFLLWPELEAIIRRQPRIEGEPRIFPFNGNVIGQKFCHAKKQLAAAMPEIRTLRFHDLRGTAISMWILRGLTIEEVRVAVSGHDTNQILERVYDRRDASDLAGKPKFASLLERPMLLAA